jgi:LuxR family maltose regulon positive regulatory protein
MNDGAQTTTAIADELRAAQRHIIERPRLTKLLDEAEAQLILLVAPAGYGKTTLAREWLAQSGRTALWFRARTGTSGIAATARGLARAMNPESPGAEKTVREFLVAHPEPDPEVLAQLLAEEVGAWSSHCWLVIDEYELLVGNDVSERCVEVFVKESGARVLVTSRERPGWVSPRELLYGDALEVRRTALAMTLEEATDVLEHAPHVPAGVVALADGWPAVIGLAALLSGEVEPEFDVNVELFDYLAQELFDDLDPVVQRHLVLLSVPSTLTPALVRAVIGSDTERVLRDSVRVGLMSVRDGHDLEIHPLCRSFLTQKLWDVGVPDDHINALAEHLIDTGQWDDAFDVIVRFDLIGQFTLLLTRALRNALADGRGDTVAGWIKWAEQKGFEAPVMSLARAEIYLRRGDWQLSESLALSCAKTVGPPDLAAQAHLCAGMAAGLLEDGKRAYSHYSNALESNDSAETRRKALWGQFTASVGIDRTANLNALTALEDARDATPEHLLRIHQARLHVASFDGNMSVVAAAALAAEPLLEHIDDPLVRSGFLNIVADQLAVISRYREAERVATRQVLESERFHLAFVLPFGLVNLSAAKLGLGAYTASAALLERSEREDRTHDDFLRMKREVTRARMHLSRGDARSATKLMQQLTLEGMRPDVAGEAIATTALAYACLSDAPNALLELERAIPLASDITAQVLIAATNAILALQEVDAVLERQIDNLAQAVIATGSFDGAVCALRAEPALLLASVRNTAMRKVVRIAAERSGDASLGGALGSTTIARARTKTTLSAREREVLNLAAEGFHNVEIGRRLFISPKTVKTHLQNIYEKLDVRSRTEAAVKAKDAGLLR